jgi:hypothetical protein
MTTSTPSREDDELTSVPGCVAELVVSGPGRPPLIAAPEVPEIAVPVSSGNIHSFGMPLERLSDPGGRDDPVPFVHPVVEVEETELRHVSRGDVDLAESPVVPVVVGCPL